MNLARISLVTAAVAALLIVGSGCSSFRRDARAARSHTPAPGSIEGQWEGRWYSLAKPEHGGAMSMVLTRTGDNLYHASTRSHWWRIFRSSYDTELVMTPVRPGEFLVMGGRNLWALGGYSVTGRVDSARFDAGFWVGSNQGRMELRRAGPAEAK